MKNSGGWAGCAWHPTHCWTARDQNCFHPVILELCVQHQKRDLQEAGGQTSMELKEEV